MSKTTSIIIIVAVVVVVGLGIIYFLPEGRGNYYPNTSVVPTNNQLNQPVNNQSSQLSGGITNTVPKTYNITIQNFSFSPAVLMINSGDTVIWTNKDSVPHRPNGSIFHSNVLNPGQSFSFTFNTAGNFDYICLIHTYMKGRVIVQ